jgi:thiamine biosynthesis protein ThiI
VSVVIAVMKFIVKFFPEITIKSKPVRRQFVAQLRKNITRILKTVDPDVVVEREWDRISILSDVKTDDEQQALVNALGAIPGIAHFIDVQEYPLGDFDDILKRVLPVYRDRLVGKTFAMRCKRTGQHDFRSIDVERHVGGGMNQHSEARGVQLKAPDVTVAIEIRNQTLYVVNQRHQGLGGFPMGSLDPVLSLVSGGFDSTVASYLTMKRGMRTHFCFCSLGGRDHEMGVKEISLYLWLKYGSSHRVRFVTVPFEDVVAELLGKIENSQMGVILKRMMLRAGTAIAEQLNVDALVTGECVSQVSSQTLKNLAVIDRATDHLVLRPLITANKEEIIKISAEIGAEAFAAAIPEYCGVISVNPTTRARPERIAVEEDKFDFGILERAIESAEMVTIDELVGDDFSDSGVEIMGIPSSDSIIIDIRHPDEESLIPLQGAALTVTRMPFYELHSRLAELDREQSYMLYCGKGVMSKLQASHLLELGYSRVKVYKPA